MLKKINKQNIFLILLASLLLSFSFNIFNPEKLPLVRSGETLYASDDLLLTPGDEKIELPSTKVNDQPMAISMEQAYKLFQSKGVLFVDARDQWEFSDGRIQGAINLPQYKFDEMKRTLNGYDKNTVIVTYCDSEDCGLSSKLAEQIMGLGYFQKVFYFKAGWSEWLLAGLPVEGEAI